MLLTLAATAHLVFSSNQAFDFSYILLPILLWTALRFRMPGVALALPILTVIIIRHTAEGYGLFAEEGISVEERTLFVQSCLGVCSVSLLVLAAEITHRQTVQRDLKLAHEELEARVLRRTSQLQTANKLLAESEERYRRLFETVPDAVVVLDGETKRLISANDAFLNIYGYTREDLPVLKLHDLTAELDGSEKSIARTEPEGLISIPVRLHRRKDGTIFPVEISASSFLLGNQRVLCGIIRDITERKKAEVSLREANEKLQREIVVREAEQAARIAGEKLAATGRLAAMIAHEINNPLNGIINSIRVVKAGIPTDNRDYKFVTLIERELQRIATIVRRMFSLYKQQADSASSFQLCQVVKDVINLSQPAADSHGIQLVGEVPSEPVQIFQPEAAVSEVLYNIVKNAMEASPKDSVVRIKLEGDEQWAHISVCDQGHGIPEELHKKIFEPFFSTKQGSGQSGMGLGLSTVREHVEVMGGRLRFESATGKGTTFFIDLPSRSTAPVASPASLQT